MNGMHMDPQGLLSHHGKLSRGDRVGRPGAALGRLLDLFGTRFGAILGRLLGPLGARLGLFGRLSRPGELSWGHRVGQSWKKILEFLAGQNKSQNGIGNRKAHTNTPNRKPHLACPAAAGQGCKCRCLGQASLRLEKGRQRSTRFDILVEPPRTPWSALASNGRP